MKTITTLLVVIIVTGIIFSIIYGGYLGVSYLWSEYLLLDFAIRTVLLSSMAVILLGAIMIAGAIKSAAQLANRRQLMEAQLEIYKPLVHLFEQYLVNDQGSTPKIITELLEKLANLESDLLILASGPVLDVHGKLVNAIGEQDSDENVNRLFQQLVRNIRRDLGHGPSSNESRLKFLVSSNRNENTDRPNPGVSL